MWKTGDQQERGPAGGCRLLLRGAVVTVTGGVSVVLTGTVALWIEPALLLRLVTPACQARRTVFAAITVQGVPFMLLGMLVSAAISTFVPASVFSRVLPRNPALAVPVAGAASRRRPSHKLSSGAASSGLACFLDAWGLPPFS
ncbi:hypothetical protein ACFWJ5_29015 [Streptomyces qaidamensis]|uniref:hypothetical protein n=1 Tax=Streptomyces qaidamensis TaxID=1783515 RepID=UPI003646C728